MDADLSRRPSLSKFTLTAPEIIDEALRRAFFTSSTFDRLDRWTVQRQHESPILDKITRIFPNQSGIEIRQQPDESKSVIFSSPEDSKAFREQFKESYLPVLSVLFDDLALLRPHYTACIATERWIFDGPSTTYKDMWRQVFCGGEGLYYSLATSDDTGTQRRRDMVQAIREIETDFANRRSALFGSLRNTVDIVYQAFLSKAFLVGYVTAVEYIVREGATEDWSSAAQELIAALNSFANNNWVALLTKLRPLLLVSGGIDPKVLAYLSQSFCSHVRP